MSHVFKKDHQAGNGRDGKVRARALSNDSKRNGPWRHDVRPFSCALPHKACQGTRAVSSSTPSPASERNCKRTEEHDGCNQKWQTKWEFWQLWDFFCLRMVSGVPILVGERTIRSKRNSKDLCFFVMNLVVKLGNKCLPNAFQSSDYPKTLSLIRVAHAQLFNRMLAACNTLLGSQFRSGWKTMQIQFDTTTSQLSFFRRAVVSFPALPAIRFAELESTKAFLCH